MSSEETKNEVTIEAAYQVLSHRKGPRITMDEEKKAVEFVSKNRQQYSQYVDDKASAYADKVPGLDIAAEESKTWAADVVTELASATYATVLPEDEPWFAGLGYKFEENPLAGQLPIPLPKGVLFTAEEVGPGMIRLSQVMKDFYDKVAGVEQKKLDELAKKGEEQYRAVLERHRGKLVMVEFYIDDDTHCEKFDGVMNKLVKRFPELVVERVNYNDGLAMAAYGRVEAVPTAFFHDLRFVKKDVSATFIKSYVGETPFETLFTDVYHQKTKFEQPEYCL